MRYTTILTTLMLLAFALPACAQQRSPAAEPAAASRPLAAMAEQAVIVLPARYLRASDSLGWAAQVADERAWLAGLDDEIAFALRERGAARRWTLPADLARSARRNAAFAPDPATVAAEPLRPRRGELAKRVPEPLISQLRSLIALRDEVRFALLPVEVRFEPADASAAGGRAVLRLVLVDVRAAEIMWVTDVQSEQTDALSPALAASLGARVADLVAAP
jgi:hypothetical protein